MNDLKIKRDELLNELSTLTQILHPMFTTKIKKNAYLTSK